MSTWYISPLLSPGHASSVLGIGLRRAEGFEQFPQFLIVGTAKAHGEVRAQRCGQQTESLLDPFSRHPPRLGPVASLGDQGGQPLHLGYFDMVGTGADAPNLGAYLAQPLV